MVDDLVEIPAVQAERLPDEFEAKLEIHFKGECGDLRDAIPTDATDDEVKMFAREAIISGDVLGVPQDANPDFANYKVDRFAPNDAYPYNRIKIRPKTAFGGGSSWSDDAYYEKSEVKASTGVPTFDYDLKVKSGREEVKAHKTLDPSSIRNTVTGTRESRDSEAHPESNAIMVFFDVTGSMGRVPRTLQAQLPKLMGLLGDKGYIDHPQVLFGAIGDATCDKVPLQVGQFESGVEMDDDVSNIFIESGGGSYGRESYELAMYFGARLTSTDCFEKRGKKGYMFIIGDELPYSSVKYKEVKSVFGNTIQNIPTKDIIAELKEKYEVFFVIPQHAQGGIRDHWVKLLGEQFVINLQSDEAVCDSIGFAVGLMEGKASFSKLAEDVEAPAHVVDEVSRALKPLSEWRAL